MLNLTPVLMAVGGFLAFRAVARSRSYVRVGADGVRVRNYPRKALLLPLDQVDRFDTTGSSRVVLVRRDGTTMGLMGLSRRPSRTPTMLNNEVAAAGNVPVDAGVVTQEAHPDPPEIRSRMAVLAHLGIVVLAVVVPLVVLLTARPGDQFTRAHARSAVNFQGTFLIVWIVLGGIMSTVRLSMVRCPCGSTRRCCWSAGRQ